MTILSKAWNNFKTHPDIWFFYGFLLTFTLSIRKVLVFYPIASQFNEWTGIYLYLSDIFLVIAIFLWAIFILQNKYTDLSRDNIYLWLKQAKICLPLILVVWSFISIFWSENQNIALFKAIKLLEFYLLYLFIIFRFIPLFHMEQKYKYHPEPDSGSNEIPDQTWNDKAVKYGVTISLFVPISIILGLIQAIIGIGQFILQHSVGLFWFKESLISPDLPGVAKIVFNGEKFIRVYGLFPHPNILGGFLLVSIIITWAYYKMFHAEHLCHPELVSGSNKIPDQTWNDIYLGLGMTILLLVQLVALILTFSKSAILGLIVAFLYVFWKNKEMFRPRRNVPCGTSYGAGVEHLSKKVIIIAIILILSLYLTGLNFGDNLEKSYGDRLNQLEVWKSLIQNNLLLGVGAGNYMFYVEHNYSNLENWKYQPIHNVFLLILAELGIVGVSVFILFLWKLYKTPSPLRGEGWGEAFKSILLAFIFIMLFDHYLWDIQQGQIMLWLVLGFVAGCKRKGRE